MALETNVNKHFISCLKLMHIETLFFISYSQLMNRYNAKSLHAKMQPTFSGNYNENIMAKELVNVNKDCHCHSVGLVNNYVGHPVYSTNTEWLTFLIIEIKLV